jgi:hypothetical protein
MYKVLLFICTSVACAVGPSVTMYSTDFSFKNLDLKKIYFNFQKSLKNQYLSHSESNLTK